MLQSSKLLSLINSRLLGDSFSHLEVQTWCVLPHFATTTEHHFYLAIGSNDHAQFIKAMQNAMTKITILPAQSSKRHDKSWPGGERLHKIL